MTATIINLDDHRTTIPAEILDPRETAKVDEDKPDYRPGPPIFAALTPNEKYLSEIMIGLPKTD